MPHLQSIYKSFFLPCYAIHIMQQELYTFFFAITEKLNFLNIFRYLMIQLAENYTGQVNEKGIDERKNPVSSDFSQYTGLNSTHTIQARKYIILAFPV